MIHSSTTIKLELELCCDNCGKEIYGILDDCGELRIEPCGECLYQAEEKGKQNA